MASQKHIFYYILKIVILIIYFSTLCINVKTDDYTIFYNRLFHFYSPSIISPELLSPVIMSISALLSVLSNVVSMPGPYSDEL